MIDQIRSDAAGAGQCDASITCGSAVPNDPVVPAGHEQPRWPDAGASPPLGRCRPIAIAPDVTTETIESRAGAADGRRRSDRHVILYLAFLSALMAVSIDTALPAFDEIRDHFGLTSADNRVSLIITSFFIGAAIGHLFYGPFSDRFGRGPVLRAGMVVYVLGAAGRHARAVDDGAARVPLRVGARAPRGPVCCGWRSPATSTRGTGWRA